MICNGLANFGLASVFYYYAFGSYLDGMSTARDLAVIGFMFTVIGLGSFRILGHLSNRTRAFLGAALLVVAVIELGFSFLFLSFAYWSESLSLLEVGIPLLIASVSSFASVVQEYRDARRRRATALKRRG